MKRSELTEFAVEEEGFKLKICRGTTEVPVVTTSRPPAAHSGGVESPISQPGNPLSNASGQGNSAASAPVEEPGVSYIKSPMVGTFYRAASPESKSFVEADSKVVENTVVCIIEAMKIMNEIQAEAKGTIIEALVENGQPVEYGQRLFKIKQG